MGDYKEYQERMVQKIQSCIESMECLPILFIGSGISKRYFNAPNWEQLLSHLAEKNPISKPFAYYMQNCNDLCEVGSKLAFDYNEWAWGNGQDYFDKELYDAGNKSDVFIKNEIYSYLKSVTPNEISEISDVHTTEIELLRSISPHAIITTNYDTFMELLFPEYESIIGQQILRAQYQSIGEIFKIHGCISNVSKIVLTSEDYREFFKRKKYLSAKLLTYFLEHPIFIFGYSVTDENIKAILSDIDEILVSEGELVENIFLVEWNKDITEESNCSDESLIQLDAGRSIRVNKIVAKDYDWIYRTLAIDTPIENVNPKLLRALLSRTYELVRTDVPRKTIEIDYAALRSALSDKADIGKIFGITNLLNPSAFNINYQYSLTDVGRAIGYQSWHGANKLLDKIVEDKGICIKESDNKYHIAILNGEHVTVRKYSEELVQLLMKVEAVEEYEVEL